MTVSAQRFLVAAVAMTCACGGDPKPLTSQVPIAIPTAIEPPPPPPPPRLVVRPSAPAHLRAFTRTAPAELLLVGQRGERWLLDEATNAARPSEIPIPEDVDAVTRSRTGTLLFVGTSGTIYAATDVVGPIGAVRRAPKRMRWVAAGAGSVVGIDRDGAIVRTDDGGNAWRTVVAADPNVMFLQLAMNDDGRGLALGVPHRILGTEDGGATWRPIASPGIGAVRLHVSEKGTLLVEGTKAFASFETAGLVKVPRPYDEIRRELELTLAKPTVSTAIDPTGRATVLDGDRIFVLPPRANTLVRGAIGETPELVPLSPSLGEAIGMAARGHFVALAGNKSGGLAYATSDDDGTTFRTVGKGDGNEGRLWISGTGVLFTVGAKGALVRHAGDDESVVIAGAAIESVVFDEPRNRVYALDHTAGEGWKLYASLDGGASFAAIESPPDADPIDSRDLTHALSVDDDGAVRLVLHSLRQSGKSTLFVRGASGTWEPAKDLAFPALGMAGRRGLAIDEWGSLFETLDGAASFRRIADGERPLELRDRRTIGTVMSPICSAGGCIVDERLTRVGWNAITPPVGAPATSESSQELAAGSTLACTVEKDWIALGRAGMPNVDDYIPGSHVRFQVSHIDRKTGAAGAWIWRESSTGLVLEDKPLQPPGGPDTATDSFAELGVAGAFRFSFKRDKALAGSRGTIPAQSVDLELAWLEAETGKIHRVKLPRAKMPDPTADLEQLPEGAVITRGDEAVRKDGVYIRPFALASTGAPLWFVTWDGKIESLTWPETRGAPNQDYEPVAEIARGANGRTVILHGRRNGMQMETSWWNAATKDWDVRTWSGWPGFILGLGADVWWSAGRRGREPAARIGMTGTYDLPASQWTTTLASPTNDPEFVAFPGQASLSDPPRACTGTSDQAYSASHAYGATHPIVVEGDREPIILYTAYALLRSDAGPTCAYVYDAKAPRKTNGFDHRAFFLLSDLAHSALFRKDDATKEVSYRPMSCSWDKREVPRELESVSGFRRFASRPY